MIEPEPAPFAPDMRRQQPGLAPERHQFAPQLRGRPVRGLPRIVLVRDDPSRTKRSVRSFSSTRSSDSEKSIGYSGWSRARAASNGAYRSGFPPNRQGNVQ